VGRSDYYSDLHFGKTEIFLFWGLATAGKSRIPPAQAGGFDPAKSDVTTDWSTTPV
jgi:hypothetical protein